MALETNEKLGARVPLKVAVRKDNWWLKPLLTVIGLGLFAVYATLRAFEGNFYEFHSYLSPFYSPLIKPGWSVGAWVISPALYILVFPLAFRMTCYYYRQAYYRSFFWDPASCAVPEPSGRKHYNGERGFPLVLQNLHRYALYAALVFLVFLWWDVLVAFTYDGHFSIGVGTLIMLANILLLTGYTFGCHALRHLVGGRLDCFTCPMADGHHQPGASYKLWRGVTVFNINHMQWAWCSLFSVILTDLYIRLCATGAITDIRFF